MINIILFFSYVTYCLLRIYYQSPYCYGDEYNLIIENCVKDFNFKEVLRFNLLILTILLFFTIDLTFAHVDNQIFVEPIDNLENGQNNNIHTRFIEVQVHRYNFRLEVIEEEAADIQEGGNILEGEEELQHQEVERIESQQNLEDGRDNEEAEIHNEQDLVEAADVNEGEQVVPGETNEEEIEIEELEGVGVEIIQPIEQEEITGIQGFEREQGSEDERIAQEREQEEFIAQNEEVLQEENGQEREQETEEVFNGRGEAEEREGEGFNEEAEIVGVVQNELLEEQQGVTVGNRIEQTENREEHEVIEADAQLRAANSEEANYVDELIHNQLNNSGEAGTSANIENTNENRNIAICPVYLNPSLIAIDNKLRFKRFARTFNIAADSFEY